MSAKANVANYTGLRVTQSLEGPWTNDRVCSDDEPTDESVFGVRLQCWPDRATVTVIVNNRCDKSEKHYIDDKEPICWVPTLGMNDTFTVSYYKECWEDRARRMLRMDTDG